MDNDNNKRKTKHKFSLHKLIIQIFFSPIIIFFITWFIYADIRKAALVTLYALTFFNLTSLIFKFFKLILSSVTFNIFGVIRNSIQIISAIIVTFLYWIIYVIIWGSNYTL